MAIDLQAAAALVGSLLGAAGTLAVRYQRPRGVLTPWGTLEPGWQQQIGAFYAISPKFVDGVDRFSGFAKSHSLLLEGAAAGLERQGWGYHYCQTDARAEAEGRLAGQVADELDLRTYYWNAEKQWGGTKNTAGADDPIRTSIIFAETFHATTRSRRRLAWNAYTSESARWHGSRHAILDVPQNVGLFQVWSPMYYGSNPAIVAKKWRASATKWRGTFPGMIVAPMVATGRQLPQGGYMGYAFDQGDVPGLLSLVAEARPEGICFWYGAGSTGMLTVGNDQNPPLPLLLKYLKNRSSGRALAVS